MRGLLVGFLFGAAAVTVAGCPLGGACGDVEDRPLEDGTYRSAEHTGAAPFHPDVSRSLELNGDTVTIRWTEDGVETVETWRVGEVRIWD